MKMPKRENDTKESDRQVMEGGRGVYVVGLVDRHRSTGGDSFFLALLANGSHHSFFGSSNLLFCSSFGSSWLIAK